MQKTQGIILSLPGDITLTEVIDDILNRSGLPESDQEFFEKTIKGDEPRTLILRDAMITIAERKLSKEKLLNLLIKHLKTSTENAEKIFQDINLKLIPFVKVLGFSNDGVTQEKPKPISYVKKPDIIDVQENSKKFSSKKKDAKNETIQTPPEEKKSDVYRESVE